MTLEEAILHCEEVTICSKGGCADEHRQLAEWLKELKAYRETYPYGVDGFNGSDTPQTDKDKVVCPNCGKSDYIRSFEKDFNIKNSEYRYKCINCNTYIKDTPQTELTAKCLNCRNAKACKEKHWDGCIYEPQTDCDDCIWNVCNYNKVEWDADTPQTDCGWGEPK